MQHPATLGDTEIVAYLADERHVSRSTQMQALSALLLVYREVLVVPVGDLRRVLRSSSPTRLPSVLSRTEVRAAVSRPHGTARLIAVLLYGSGLRLVECVSLQVKDVDLAGGEIRVRRGNGGKDRICMLPAVARLALKRQLARVRLRHAKDLDAGAGSVALPTALERKAPSWSTDLAWQWVFPGLDPISWTPDSPEFMGGGGTWDRASRSSGVSVARLVRSSRRRRCGWWRSGERVARR